MSMGPRWQEQGVTKAFYITERQAQTVAEMAANEQTTQSEIVRRALAAYFFSPVKAKNPSRIREAS